MQLQLHLVDRLGTEVADVQQILLATRHQLRDGVDALTLEAVVGPYRQVEILDRQSEVRGQLLIDWRRADLNAFSFHIELTSKAEELDQRTTCRSDGIARTDGRLGLYIQDQLVKVGALLDTGRLDLVGDLQHRRVNRIDRDTADLGVGSLVLHCGDVATAPLNYQLHIEPAGVIQGGNVQLWVVHLDTGWRGNICGSYLTGARLAQVHRDRLVLFGGHNQALEVQDDLGDIFDDALQSGELMQVAVDLDARHGRARNRGQQRTP